MQYVRNLPWFAQVNVVPKEWQIFGVMTVLPLWAGGIAVHALPLVDEEVTTIMMENDTSRKVLGSTMHYASVLVGVQAGLHWGMQAINFGLPTHTLEYTPLYRFFRFGLPIVPLTVAVLASRLSVENPRAAAVVLMCVTAVSTGSDIFSYAFATSPVWFPRFQWYIALGIIGGLFFLITSERTKIRGDTFVIGE